MKTAADVVERMLPLIGPLALAARAGRKTQTRRPLDRILEYGKVTEFGPSDTTGYAWHFRDSAERWHDLRHGELLERCPYGRVGDRLWVRETWQRIGDGETTDDVVYRADFLDDPHGPDGELAPEGRYRFWRPSRSMPRWASRTTLVITGVVVERLLAIDEADAVAEGFGEPGDSPDDEAARRRFLRCWHEIYGLDLFDPNPWVWAPRFELETPAGKRKKGSK